MEGKIDLDNEGGKTIPLLIEKSKEGDLDAFSELIRLYREKVYGVAFSFLNNHHDAEEISQEAFIQVFKKLNSFESSGSFSAWLLTIVANMSKNKIRWKRLREKLTFSMDATTDNSEEDELPKLQVADTKKEIDPSYNAEKSWVSQQVANAMAALSAQQRSAIHLKFVQGFTILEIAKTMNLAEGTVKSHIFRGIESLMKTIKVNPNEL